MKKLILILLVLFAGNSFASSGITPYQWERIMAANQFNNGQGSYNGQHLNFERSNFYQRPVPFRNSNTNENMINLDSWRRINGLEDRYTTMPVKPPFYNDGNRYTTMPVHPPFQGFPGRINDGNRYTIMPINPPGGYKIQNNFIRYNSAR